MLPPNMWADNETTADLLGFAVHADLLENVVSNPKLLPMVIGLFGDWGSGKSSVMRMLEARFTADKYKEAVACLYFNGWVFEGYQDAKTALLASILKQLIEHERLGPKLKEKAVGLLKRVKWMEVAKLGVKHVGIPLVAGLLSGGAGAAAALALGVAAGKAAEDGAQSKPALESIGWGELINTDPEKPDLIGIRQFRDDFAGMLKDCKIEALVILIDDLDRCLPDRIIDTLEAIKLFVAVPNTAFVIGADPRIVRHAIATRYVEPQLKDPTSSTRERYDLITDYLEKLIQIPYHLPRLSPAEIETYVNLLACHQFLLPDLYDRACNDWRARRVKNFYAPYTRTSICTALQTQELVPELEQHLAWSQVIAPVITEGLKGNPRQIKRMLNAMILRQRLAQVAGISIREAVLAKLMVLEYAHFERFRELNDWQVASGGFPPEIRKLEEYVAAASSDSPSEELPKDWMKPSVQKWLRMEPPLHDIDLRDYFWLARDRTTSTLTGVTMVAPIVRRLCDQLVGNNRGTKHSSAREAVGLGELEQEQLLDLLRQRVERQTEDEGAYEAFELLHQNKMPGVLATLGTALRRANASNIPPSVAYKLQGLPSSDSSSKDTVRELLEYLKGTGKTRVGKAAEKVLGAGV